jgi:hypothetical protein
MNSTVGNRFFPDCFTVNCSLPTAYCLLITYSYIDILFSE